MFYVCVCDIRWLCVYMCLCVRCVCWLPCFRCAMRCLCDGCSRGRSTEFIHFTLQGYLHWVTVAVWGVVCGLWFVLWSVLFCCLLYALYSILFLFICHSISTICVNYLLYTPPLSAILEHKPSVSTIPLYTTLYHSITIYNHL